MVTGRKRVEPCHSAQAPLDGAAPIVVAAAVSARVADIQPLRGNTIDRPETSPTDQV